MRVAETDSADTFKVSGRGELHLSILIETMRRQNYEFQVSRPQVITKVIDGVLSEPMEFLMIEVPQDYVGAVMEKLGARKAELINMGTRDGGSTHIEFRIPSRGLMGYRAEFLTDTNGNGIMNHVLGRDYHPPSRLADSPRNRRNGCLRSVPGSGKRKAFYRSGRSRIRGNDCRRKSQIRGYHR